MKAGGDLDLELKRLLVGTNDQRRRVGQTLFHFYRTLIFWKDKGLSFTAVTRAWSAGGAAVFDALAASLREVRAGPDDASTSPERDQDLRVFVAVFLDRLAADLDRGDAMLVPFLRWLEERFPEITRMMQQEAPDSRIHDVALAEDLAALFVHVARADRKQVPAVLSAAADAIR